jgi:hypothetical protein
VYPQENKLCFLNYLNPRSCKRKESTTKLPKQLDITKHREQMLESGESPCVRTPDGPSTAEWGGFGVEMGRLDMHGREEVWVANDRIADV